MRLCPLLVLSLSCCSAVLAINDGSAKIVISNDDGWATANIRAQNSALREAGHNVIISAPAENKSGSGSLDFPPGQVGSSGCEFDSCPPNSPATGSDPDDNRINYVNSYPVTSVKYGISTTGPQFFDGTKPDLVVSGPNVGTNLGLAVFFSGTVGVACEAAKQGIPAIALSGSGGAHVSYTTLNTSSDSTTSANVFASLGATLVEQLINSTASASSPTLLPSDVVLNINYSPASSARGCTSPSSYIYILTRIFSSTIFTPSDVSWCGSSRLPTESHVIGLDTGCYASISVMDPNTKTDASKQKQQEVLEILGTLLSCLPS
ncbi:acid phosphatase [Pyrrhoderma noxium]|uniref:Acid phosphatase n=1 Tax=Pyrrhoderma noxium TaxID=2282107 RepID=A0A286U5U0_9AGAM|nr:acid phosphatase [Pyrrhoderma noxium]